MAGIAYIETSGGLERNTCFSHLNQYAVLFVVFSFAMERSRGDRDVLRHYAKSATENPSLSLYALRRIWTARSRWR
jgi:hypothetical protein